VATNTLKREAVTPRSPIWYSVQELLHNHLGNQPNLRPHTLIRNIDNLDSLDSLEIPLGNRS